jgi:hypothetical protein
MADGFKEVRISEFLLSKKVETGRKIKRQFLSLQQFSG